jgi:hypothetical protein
VTELVGIDYRAHALHDAIGDVEGEHADYLFIGGEQYRSCLAIHLMESDDDAELTDLPAQPTEQSGDALRSNYRLHPLWSFATPVAVKEAIR